MQNILRSINSLLLVKIQLNLLKQRITQNVNRHPLIGLKQLNEVVKNFLSSINIVVLLDEYKCECLVQSWRVFIPFSGKLINQEDHEVD